MLFKRKRKKEFHLTPEEARQVIREHWEYARRFAEQGNVAGMEMALEVVINYSHAINEVVSRDEINRLKLIGYERGIENLSTRIDALRLEGKEEEADRLMTLVRSYRREAASIREEMERRERMRRKRFKPEVEI